MIIVDLNCYALTCFNPAAFVNKLPDGIDFVGPFPPEVTLQTKNKMPLARHYVF
jgi:hypothetical protein